MRKIINNEKGGTIVIVLIVVTVLIILSSALFEISLNTYKYTKKTGDLDLLYVAGESSCEVWFDKMDTKFKDTTPNMVQGYAIDKNDSDSIRTYVKNILDNEILHIDGSDSNLLEAYKHSPEGTDGTLEQTTAEVIRLDCRSAEINSVKNTVTATVGVVYFTSFDGLSGSSPYQEKSFSSKVSYQEREFDIPLPYSDVLIEGAIYSVGDVFIANKGFLNVTGDIYSFGTYAETVGTTKQHYFGGVMVLDNGKLNTNGNIYTRGLIRVGTYDTVNNRGSEDDTLKAEIIATRDMVAQGLQIFGDDARILVGRNAYTFDDVEINGPNSVIAINGNYIGLERATSSAYHDNNSGVVNTAIIHNSYSKSASRSVICINGDVIIPGGSYKIENDGTISGQIEDATLAYDNTIGIIGTLADPLFVPYYKLNHVDAGYHERLIEGYHEDRLKTYKRGAGYTSLIQIFAPIDFSNSLKRGNWLADINDIRGSWNNIGVFASSLSNPLANKPDKITGYSTFEIACNDQLYWPNDPPTTTITPINEILMLSKSKSNLLAGGDFVLDGFNESEIIQNTGGIITDWSEIDDFWNNYWSSKMNTGGTWTDYSSSIVGKSSEITGIIVELKKLLYKKTQMFATREYPTNPVDSWKIGGEDKFNQLYDKLASKITNPKHPKIKEGSDIDYKTSSLGCSRAVGSTLVELSAQNDFYVILNDDPAQDITVDGIFNGIICTKGKVIINEGADIYGAIIAAGAGKNGTGSSADTGNLPTVNSVADSNKLIAGDFAGIVHAPVAPAAPITATIDFTCGIDIQALYGVPISHLEGKIASNNLYKIFKEQSDSLDLWEVLIGHNPTP